MTVTILERVGVEPAERRLFAWAALCLLLTGAAAYALLNSSETLFLKRVGVQYLPLVLLGSSGLLIVTTGLLGRRLATADRAAWLPRVLLTLGLLVAPFGWLIDAWDSALVFGALLLLARQVLALGLMVFWMVLADLLTGRQAKRLFAPLAAGVTVGGIAGSFGSDATARLVGIQGLLLACGMSLAVAALAATRLSAARPRRLERGLQARGRADSGRRRAGAGDDRVGALEVWRQSRLFRLLALSLLCGGLLSPIVYYEFSYVADLATAGSGGEARLLALYAQLRGWLNVALLLAQLWLSGRLYQRFGLPLSLALWPASYVLGLLGLGLVLTLPVGIFALAASRITEDGIGGSALRVLFSLFPERLRARAAGLLEGPINRLGGTLGNAFMLVIIPLGLTRILPWSVLPLACLWLLAALALWRAYPALLLKASSDRSLAGADKAELLDPATVRALAPGLADPDPAVCRAAIALIADADPAVAVEVLADGVARAHPVNRPMIVAALQRVVEPCEPGALGRAGRGPRAVAAIEGLLASPAPLAPETRADLLRIYARLTGGRDGRDDERSLDVLRDGLGDREAAVRLAAMAELHRRGLPPPGAADLDRTLRGALAAGDVLVRRSARKELRAMLLSTKPDESWRDRFELLASGLRQRVDRVETAEALVEVARTQPLEALPAAGAVADRLDDADARARAPLLRFVGHAALSDHAPRLTAALGSRDPGEAAAARDGLIALGPAVAHALLKEYEFGAASHRDGVMKVLRELHVDTQSLADGYRRELAEVRRIVMLRGALGEDQPDALLPRRLEERTAQGVGALLAHVAVLQDDPRIAELERRLLRARDERGRDLLVEALEALLPPETRADLLPLLEPRAWPERAASAAADLGRRSPTREEAVSELALDGEELTVRLAERAARALSGVETAAAIVHPVGMLDPIEVAVRLQDVPAFARLDTQQLVALAGMLEESSYDVDQTIFSEGDEGDGLYVVVEGEVVASRAGVDVAVHGPGTFFGELSTLDGIPRSTTATARSASRLLRLGREDLVALMADAPALAIGLAEFLALRVRELQERETRSA